MAERLGEGLGESGDIFDGDGFCFVGELEFGEINERGEVLLLAFGEEIFGEI